MTLRVGSLFSGYGGLDLGLSMVLDAEPVWMVEYDKHPSAVLAQRYPGVVNYGDVTAVDWASVPPVDVLTGGYPCQPFSHAGTRKGTTDDRHLWPYFADAIRVLRPRLVVLENVSGHLTLGFDEVLADLAALGFDAEWGVVSASDAGAPHRRQRLFVVARDTQGGRERAAFTDGGGQRRPAGPPGSSGGDPVADAGGGQLPRPAIGGHRLPVAGERGDPGDGLTLLPTPAVNDMGRGKTPEGWDDWTDAMRARHGNGNGHGKSLEIEAQRLLPTPTSQAAKHGSTPDVTANGHGSNLWDLPTLLPTPRATDGTKGGPNQAGSSGDLMLPSAVQPERFGPYSAAIARWEQVLGRPAPPPTEPGKDGRSRLSPVFVEWLMGIPEGWVTGTGIPRNAQLKALGNGVVPQQAALALSMLLPRLYGGQAAGAGAVADVPLLPTPNAALGSGGQTSRSGDRKGEPLLGNIAALLPTPTVSDTRDGAVPRQMSIDAMGRGSSKGVNLNHLFEHDDLHDFLMGRDA